ncbi:hypothetical protein PR048_018697 [Dryococelus australis]|uniref:Uncharacterized protein n=1 Tax=Dryococelus australis TaxID=614101 RepID=A0ABQ9HD65_9NEOP|nr:hypothetical protein PR048_018697 [Dryococelus australis]
MIAKLKFLRQCFYILSVLQITDMTTQLGYKSIQYQKVESHYLSKQSKRHYVEGDLTYSKMYKHYSEWFKNQNYSCMLATERHYKEILK